MAEEKKTLFFNKKEGKYGTYYSKKVNDKYMNVNLKEGELPTVHYDGAAIEVRATKNGNPFVNVDGNSIFFNTDKETGLITERESQFGPYISANLLLGNAPTSQGGTDAVTTSNSGGYQKMPRS